MIVNGADLQDRPAGDHRAPAPHGERLRSEARRRLGTGLAAAAVLALICISCSDDDDDQAEPDSTQRPQVTTTTAPPRTPGVSDTSILFGQSAAFSGPAAALGREMRVGIEAAFHEANARGGVFGRDLSLISLDDSYEPNIAIANTQRLIEDEDVFALIGAVGTPTSRSAAPVAAESGVPYIAPFTGAGFLREIDIGEVINLRASYGEETEEMVERLFVDLGIERIGILYQDDSFGRAGFRGATDALERRGLKPVSVGLYPRNTTAVKTALVDLRQGDPDAVIMVGAYEPVAAVVKWARHMGMDTLFLTVSFVGSNALLNELGRDGAGVLVTQVVPFPTDTKLPVIASYLDALRAYDEDAEPGFVSLEGYLAGRLTAYALELCGEEVTRGCMSESLTRAGAIDLEGFELQFGRQDNQGSDSVFLTVIGSDARYHPVETLKDVAQWMGTQNG